MTGDRTPLRERLADAIPTALTATPHVGVGSARRLKIADAVLPEVEAETAALRERAEKAERERDQAIAALTRHAAEAHRSKWAHEDSNQAAFDALHRLGDEILASRDRLIAALGQAPAQAPSCSCDGDPIECSHEAARGQAESAVERVRALHRPADDWSWRDFGCKHEQEHSQLCATCRTCHPCPTLAALEPPKETPDA